MRTIPTQLELEAMLANPEYIELLKSLPDHIRRRFYSGEARVASQYTGKEKNVDALR